jgi:membrane protease YdiL (CAAX protease family)
MLRTIRPFFIALLCSWIALFVAALVYSKQHPQSHWIMTAALPAFSIEAVFYLASGFHETRDWFAGIPSGRAQAGLLWISALLPYLMFSLCAGTFERHAFYLLAALTAVLAFWHVTLPRRLAYDVGFLVIAAAPVLLRVFQRIYRSPDEHLRIDILGHLMWIRVGAAALLVLREWHPGSFSFWPRAREWKTGLFYYGLVVVPIVALALALRDVRFEPLHGEWWQIAGMTIGTFFGMLWVVALGEELFFRGVIQRALLNFWRSPAAAIGASTVLYASVHLWFREFPNWRHALVVALLGMACGTAYWRSGSVRAPMVTHALVVTTWRVLFK